jgi:dTDP-4-amino-4,6-dideoxygalactose transaminase
VLRVEKRDDLIAYLRQKGIGTEIYYPVPFHLCKSVFDTWVTKREISRNREKAAKETVAIPIYPELTAAQQGEVVEAIASFFA